MVSAGYTHVFCTPHIWPNLPLNNLQQIPLRVAELQSALDEHQIPLKLLSGGENNLRPTFMSETQQLVTYAMRGRYVLADMWADELPEFFEPTMRWLQSQRSTVILAHPERMRAVQDHPALADRFADMGVLLQGNLECFSDPPDAPTRRTAEQYLAEGRYFVIGSDLHVPKTLPKRLAGLDRIRELAGEKTLDRLTMENPRKLL